MVKFLKEYWFGCCLGLCAGLFLLFIVIVEQAPHNDPKMRGFTPCTYNMVEELSGDTINVPYVFKTVGKSYACYFGVIKKGFTQWTEGKQSTPWENYLFAIDNFEIDEKLSEPYSEDLLKSNRLN